MNVTPEEITDLGPNDIFVFGSNTQGRHGKGAALIARTKFGAKQGVGIGPTGRCFAIPTKDRNLRVLTLADISICVRRFINHARNNPHQRFLVTAIGCGLAGYTPAQIAPLFLANFLPQNIHLPQSFWDQLK